MQKLGSNNAVFYRLAVWLVPSMPLGIALIGWINGLDGSESWLINRTLIFAILQRLQDFSGVAYLICWSLFFLSVYYKKKGDPWLAEQIQFILDRYQDGAFDCANCPPEAPVDHNRVTIFRYQRGFFIRHWSATKYWRWGKYSPFSYFLAPVLRSGHISKNSKAAFYVSDNSSDTEGIAGRAWSSDGLIFEENLPKAELLTNEARRKVYAKRTGCSLEMVNRRIANGAVMPRSMLAIPIRRRGKLWGVIVLDSRYPKGIRKDASEKYQLTLALIERLLERVS